MKEEKLFHQALAQPADQRESFVAAACGDDVRLRKRVQVLLRAHANSGSFLDAPHGLPTAASVDQASSHQPGDSIGAYKLIEQIGQGGMGTVYLAEQKQPVRRTVALKVIKRGMDSEQVVARFEAERQALALMNHPNIARVLDAGMTDDGRPYFAMDLVRGIPITDYCDQHHLDRRARLELFITVCRSVQHAHQKGVIHRDLKPSNVLVELHDVAHVPKVIDFGVAKATSQQLTDRTLITHFSQMIGTPLYMSPEQAEFSGLDVDTRSDVYSLGVLLYELLTGSTPFDRETFKDASLDEMRRIIREDEPQRPSQRISTLNARDASTVADRLRVNPRQLRRDLAKELDWIVMKALEKDRSRRYESANALAADLESFLKDEPVLACPPSLVYGFRKYARRHRAQLVAIATVASLLIIGTVVSSSLAAWAVQERGLAKANERSALNSRALAEKQERLAKQQRDAAEYDAYVANTQLAFARWRQGKSVFGPLQAIAPAPRRPDFRGWEWYFLHAQTAWQRFHLPLQKPIVAWSPTGRLATVGATGLVNIWNTPSGRHERSLDPGPGIRTLSWSPDEQHLAVGTDRKQVVICDLDLGQAKQTIATAFPVGTIDWNRDGIRLAVGTEDGRVSVWEWRTRKQLASYFVEGGPVLSVDWHPQEELLLACGGEFNAKEVKIWDVTKNVEVLRRAAPTGNVASFSPDGRRFICGAEPHRVIDLESGRVVSSFGRRGTANYYHTWSPDGKRVATGLLGGQVVVMDAESSAPQLSIPGLDEFAISVAWSPVAEMLATTAPHEFKIWATDRQQENPLTLITSERDALDLAWSPNGDRLLVGSRGGAVTIFDMESGEEELHVEHGTSWNERVAFSPDGRRFASRITSNDQAAIFDAQSGQRLLSFELQGSLYGISWHPNKETIVLGSNLSRFREGRAQVAIYDAKSGDPLNTAELDSHCVEIAWSPDGEYLAMAGRSVYVLDAELREHVVLPSEWSCTCVDWSADGSRLAAGHFSGEIDIYETTDWKSVGSFEAHPGFVTDIDLHPSMPRIASSGRDGTIKVLDSETGRELCEFDDHDSHLFPTAVAWSPDGLRLASSGRDGTVRVWDGSPAVKYLQQDGHLRDRAWAAVQREDYQEAIDLLKQVRQLHPHEQALRRQLGHVEWLGAAKLAVIDRLTAALSIFERLRNESADVPDYRVHLPGKLIAEHPETALAMAERFATEFPDEEGFQNELAYLYELRATQLCATDRFDEAVPVLRELAKRFPDRPDFRQQLAFEMARADRLQPTIETFEKLAGAFDRWPDYRPQLAEHLTAAKEHGLAANVYEQLVEDYPDAAEYRTLQAIESASAMLVEGRAAEAIQLLRGLGTASPQQRASNLLGRAHLVRGRKYLDDRNLTKAIEDLAPAFELSSDEGMSRVGYELALAQLAEGQFEEYGTTCSLLQTRFGNSPLHADAWSFAWSCSLAPDAVSDFATAIKAANFAVESSDSLSYLAALGAVQFRAGQYDQALAALMQADELAETAVTTSPAYTWYFLAMTHHRLEQMEAANRWLRKANERASEELGTEQEPKEAPWNRRLTLNLLRKEAEALLGE